MCITPSLILDLNKFQMSEVQYENEGNNLDKRMDTTVQNEERYSAHSDVKLREKFGVKDLCVVLRKVEG